LDVNIICGHCNGQATYKVTGEGLHNLVCPNAKCAKPFAALLGTARAKRSRGDKRNNRRHYSLRYTTNGAEGFIEFDSDSYDDAELRAKDQFALSIVNGQTRILFNQSIGQYWQINAPAMGCLGLTITGAILLGIFMFLLSLF